MRLPTLAGCFLCLTASTTMGQETWIVDFFGAPDAHFGTIQEAVDAASDGDTILVRPGGLYEGFSVVDKALVITAELGGRIDVEIPDSIEVRDLAAGKTLVLRGFGPELVFAPADVPPTLVAQDCDGTLWLEDCSFGLLGGVTTAGAGVSLTNCFSVVAIDCQFLGGPGVELVSSGLHLFTSEITGYAIGGASGAARPGLALDGAFTFATGCTITGSIGGIDPGAVPCAEDGGPGVSMSNASELYTQDCAITGGFANFIYYQAICVSLGNPTLGSQGPSIQMDPASTAVSLPGTSHTYRTTPVARDGGSLTRTFRGEPGETVYFFESDATEPVFYPFLNGSTLTPMGTSFSVLGPLDASGVLVQDVPASLGLATTNRTSFEQAVFVDGGGVSFAGSGATTVVLDASVTLRTEPDCNQNDIGDFYELSIGAVLDCNENGVPDECEAFTPLRLQTLVAADGQDGEEFGYALDRDGDTLVVGARYERPNNTANGFDIRGAVYAFERIGGSWTQVQKIVSPFSGSGVFGTSVAVEGDTLVVGAPQAETLGHGRAYVYERSGGVWSLTQTLAQTNPTDFHYFGQQVALENGELIVAGPNDTGFIGTSCSTTPRPAVYAYRKVAGTWTFQQKITEGVNSHCFGMRVAMDGSTLAVAAPLGRSTMTGVVYLYELEAGTWVKKQQLTPDDILCCPGASAGPDHFGSALALRGDRLVAGAERKDRFEPDDGALYLYERDALGVWNLTAKLTALGAYTDEMGRAAALGEDVVLGGGMLSQSIFSGVTFGLSAFQIEPDGSWPRFESASFEMQTVGALLMVGGDVFVGTPEDGDGAVLLYELAELITPNPCLTRNPKRTERAPAPQPR